MIIETAKILLLEPIQVDTHRELSNYKHNEGRPKITSGPPAYLKDYVTLRRRRYILIRLQLNNNETKFR